VCEGGSRTINQNPQQPLISMIFTNTDPSLIPRYAGRLDNKEEDNTVAMMERVREAITFHAELADKSTWLWLTSKQMDFPLRPTGGGEFKYLDRSQRVRDHLDAYLIQATWHLAMTDCILYENQEYGNKKLEQTLTLLHVEQSKEIAPSRQTPTHHPLIISNTIDKKGLEFMRKSMRWEAPSMPTAAYDLGLLREQETPLEIGKNWFLDQEIPTGGFVIIQDTSQVQKERADKTQIITTEGLTTCLDPG